MPDAFRIRVDICYAIELMVGVLGNSSERVLLISTVGPDGYVGPGERLSLERQLLKARQTARPGLVSE